MKNVFFCCMLVLFFSCKENKTSPVLEAEPNETSIMKEVNVTNKVYDAKAMASLDWLLGDWENTSGEIKMYERWSRENNNAFSARSVSVVGNDTVFSETMKLHTANDSIFLTVTGAQEDVHQTVQFALISSEDKTFTFENKAHDFPQQIVYSNPSEDTIHAWIIGIQDGQERKSDFYFERVKE